MADPDRRGIKSYVLRQGRLTPGQQKALDAGWSLYGLETGSGVIDTERLFQNEGPITLEIGFGMGDSLVQQALDEPSRNFIGIEVHRPGVGHLLMRAIEHDLKNIRVFTEDSLVVLQEAIPDSALATVQLFFPDPWPKKRHHKRRIVNTRFADLVKQKLFADGVLHIATDWQPYADEIRILFEQNEAFEATNAPERPETKFEKRGLKLGHSISDLAYRIR